MTFRLDDVAAQATARSLDDMLAELDALPESRARTLALDSIDALLQLYGEGLTRLVLAHRERRLSDELLATDDVVMQLLGIHGLLPKSAHPPELVQLGRRRTPAEEDDAVLALEVDGETQCQLCAAPIAADHRHLLDVEHRRLTCACRACALLFDGRSAGATRYRLIPRRFRSLDPALLDGDLWERLEVPVDVAFLFVNSTTHRPVAIYPGPMGTTESTLPLPAWDEIVARSEVLATLEPDVEAVLVRRARGAREYWLVPVDECYRLAGGMRATWQGISGGDAMRGIVDAFFRRLARFDETGRHSPTAATTNREAIWQTT